MVAKREPYDTRMAVDEYLALEQTSEIKHEFVDGYVYAMSGGTINHDTIANNLRVALHASLAGGSCRMLGPDVRLRVTPEIYYYPDALVVCEPIDGESLEVSSPTLVVEVLSDSTEALDRGGKFARYQTIATLDEYVLVDARSRTVECFRHATEDLWNYQRYDGDACLSLHSLNLALPLATIYNATAL